METTAIEKIICQGNRFKEEGAGHGLEWGSGGMGGVTQVNTRVGQEAEGTGKNGKEPLVWFPRVRPGKAESVGWGLANLNHLRGLWSTGAAPVV